MARTLVESPVCTCDTMASNQPASHLLFGADPTQQINVVHSKSWGGIVSDLLILGASLGATCTSGIPLHMPMKKKRLSVDIPPCC